LKTTTKLGIGGLVAAAIVGTAYWFLSFCNHKFTRPFSHKDKDGKKVTYVNCLKCARDFEYDLKKFKVGKEIKP
jgi:hypothetical protein